MRFFFHLNHGTQEVDPSGVDLGDEDAARIEAVRFAGEVIRGEPAKLCSGPVSVDVYDAHGTLRFSVEMRLTTPELSVEGLRSY